MCRENTVSKYQLPQSVKDAALILDVEIPGWYNAIALPKLNMKSCFYCILGQMFELYQTGMDKLFDVDFASRGMRDYRTNPFWGNENRKSWIFEIKLRLTMEAARSNEQSQATKFIEVTV